MFISEILNSLHKGSFARNASAMLMKSSRHIADIREKLNYFQTLPELSSCNIRDIKSALYELLRAASCLVFSTENHALHLQDVLPMAEEFIKLLLPLPDKSEEISAASTVEYNRQEMSARVAYLISAMAGVMQKHEKGRKVNIALAQLELQNLPSPLDSRSIFLQYMYNHITDNNWAHLACLPDENFADSRRQKLLKLEYHQCRYAGKDAVNYAFYENMYRTITEQITVAFNVAVSGGRAGISPLTFRDMLKPYVSIPVEPAEQNYWCWETYCMIKAQVNGTDGKAVQGGTDIERQYFRRGGCR